MRDVMVEGDAGLLAVAPPWDRPHYEPSKRRLTWNNGAMATTYSGDKPDQLRGPSHDGAWADEPAAWRYPEAWDHLLFGLRLGTHPRIVATTTPRPTPLIKGLVKDPLVTLTRGHTMDNKANLPPSVLAALMRRYGGTRLGRQELAAEILEDNPDALWARADIEDHRTTDPGSFVRVVVGVDPAATAGEGSSETGIVVAGLGRNGHGYVLDDMTIKASPHGWGTQAVAAYHKYKADRLVAETNQGGEMVELTIRTVDRNVSYKGVHASRGKHTRAEPIAALYEQGRVHHVGMFSELEDQMCVAGDTLVETIQGPRRIDAIRAGELVLTRAGYQRVLWAGCTGKDVELLELRTSNGRSLLATAGHPVFTVERGFVPLSGLNATDELEELKCHAIAPACGRDGVVRRVVASTTARLNTPGLRRDVFNLKVEGQPEYYANGILVHNCQWVPGDASPDRLDALVWVLTELMLKGGRVEVFDYRELQYADQLRR